MKKGRLPGCRDMKDKAQKEPKQGKEEGDMLMEKQQVRTQPNILMTVKDVATYLSVTERTVYRLVKTIVCRPIRWAGNGGSRRT